MRACAFGLARACFDGMESEVVMAGLVPAIHALAAGRKTWMRGTSPRMTGIQTSETSSSGPCGPNSSIQTRIKQRSTIVLQVPTPHLPGHWQAAACPRAARKSATYRSPWSPHRQLCCHRQANTQSKIVRFRERVAKAPAPRSIRRLRAAPEALPKLPCKDKVS
jgi:hypothetical protein